MGRCLRPWSLTLAVLAAAPLSAAPRTYVVDAGASSVRIHVGKSGAFSFAGHKHEVVAPALSGEVTADPADLGASRVSLSFEAAALKVLPEGEPAGDPPKVEEAMRGPKVLDAPQFPSITFKTQRVSGRESGSGVYDLELAGELSLHGVARALTLPVHVEVAGDTLTASGKAVLRHDQFGMQPVGAAGGAVKVKNEIEIEYRIVARGR
ncbi:MAG TPA: YceI family protein [Vicinamibacteria bacterium]|nr:YceI family protein [Vicinamibacteria bacterium]